MKLTAYAGPDGGRIWLCPPCSQAQLIAIQHEQSLAHARRLVAAAGIPERHRGEADFEIEPAWTATLRGLETTLGTGCLFALHGGRGPGKTRLACELIKTACSRGLTSRYVKAMGFFLAMRATFHKDSVHCENDVMTTFVSYKLLVLDEAGVRGATAFEDRLLTSVVDERYDKRLDTIIVSNQTKADLRDALGESFVDRLRETGGFIEFNWPSFRGRLGETGADGRA